MAPVDPGSEESTLECLSGSHRQGLEDELPAGSPMDHDLFQVLRECA